MSDNDSEEVIWMPLKTFDYPSPKYQVSVSRLQVRIAIQSCFLEGYQIITT